VPTPHQRALGKARQPLKRAGHLFRGALKDPPAAGAEEGVAAEEMSAAGEVVGQVASGVARDGDGHALFAGEDHSRLVLQWDRDLGDPGLVHPRTVDGNRAEALQQLLQAAHVVVVVMGQEDCGQAAGALLQLFQDGGRLGGVDQRALVVVQASKQEHVVIRPGAQGRHGETFHVLPFPCSRRESSPRFRLPGDRSAGTKGNLEASVGQDLDSRSEGRSTGFLRNLKSAWDEVTAETPPKKAAVLLPPQGLKGSLPCP